MYTSNFVDKNKFALPTEPIQTDIRLAQFLLRQIGSKKNAIQSHHLRLCSNCVTSPHTMAARSGWLAGWLANGQDFSNSQLDHLVPNILNSPSSSQIK